MVVVGQSDSSEGTRQLRVNKKLSKAISSVSRSRFAKARPNLPGAKRSDSSVPARPSKAVECAPEVVSETVAQNADTDIGQIVQEVDVRANAPTTNTNLDRTVQQVNDLPQSSDTDAGKIVVQKIDDKATAESSDTDACIIVQDIDDKPTAESSDANVSKIVQQIDDKATAESSDTDASKTIEDMCIKAQIQDTNIAEAVEEVGSQTVAQAENTDTGGPVEKVEGQAEIAKIADTDVSKTVAVSHEAITQTAVTSVGSSPDPPNTASQKKTTVSNSPDKSSKYPHLTNLLTKKKNDLKKEAQKKMMRFKKLGPNPERSKMTMADLIYWNPTSTKKSPTNTEQTQKSTEVTEEVPSSNILNNAEEECVDDAPPENDMPDSVPKLVISEDGSINIDQSSLFVKRNLPQPIATEVVGNDGTTYSSFRKRPLTKHWNAKDTAKFYRALSLVGSDFSLMEQIFPHRTRRELKMKFKREEKYNIDIINRVLYETHTFDDVSLNDFINGDPDSLTDDLSSQETTEKAEKPTRKRKNAKKIKSAEEVCNSSNEQTENEAVHTKKVTKKRKTKKNNMDEDEFECEIVNNEDLGEKASSKRTRNARKLPDGFVSSDCIDEIAASEEEETNENDVSETTTIEINAETADNGPHATPKIVATLDFSDLITFDKNVKFPLKSKKKTPDKTAALDSVPLTNSNEVIDIVPESVSLSTTDKVAEIAAQTVPLPSADEEYVTVEYIQEVSEADVTMLNNVVAFEVVTSQTPSTTVKRKRKFNPVIPRKAQKTVTSMHLSPANYTPVL